jgi:hypothetical protein
MGWRLREFVLASFRLVMEGWSTREFRRKCGSMLDISAVCPINSPMVSGRSRGFDGVKIDCLLVGGSSVFYLFYLMCP